MKNGITLAACATVGLAAFAFASPAYAQATRTWVSGVGDDVNPCSRTAPCKTFAGAISKTAPGGEINCLDPGGYGTLTITKSITVDCTGTFGSTLNSGGINGFVINDSATLTPGTIEVRLRGLSINGAGSTPGLNGVRFVSGRSLVLQDVYIQNQKSGSGVSIANSSGNVTVSLFDVTVADGLQGVEVRPTGSGSAKVMLANVRVLDNSSNGLRIDSSATTGTDVQVSVNDSHISANQTGISTNSAGSRITMMVDGSSITNNTTTGVVASGLSTTMWLGNNAILGNATGVSAAGGAALNSFGNNRLQGNPNNAAPNNGTLPPATGEN
jgi:hypothetical protein